LIDGLSVYPITYRVSTILLVVQDFATIHSMSPVMEISGHFHGDFLVHPFPTLLDGVAITTSGAGCWTCFTHVPQKNG
jgi:hypothetical protein